MVLRLAGRLISAKRDFLCERAPQNVSPSNTIGDGHLRYESLLGRPVTEDIDKLENAKKCEDG